MRPACGPQGGRLVRSRDTVRPHATIARRQGGATSRCCALHVLDVSCITARSMPTQSRVAGSQTIAAQIRSGVRRAAHEIGHGHGLEWCHPDQEGRTGLMLHPWTIETDGDYHQQQLLAEAANERLVAQAKRAQQSLRGQPAVRRQGSMLRTVAAALMAVTAAALEVGAMLFGPLEARSKTNGRVG